MLFQANKDAQRPGVGWGGEGRRRLGRGGVGSGAEGREGNFYLKFGHLNNSDNFVLNTPAEIDRQTDILVHRKVPSSVKNAFSFTL